MQSPEEIRDFFSLKHYLVKSEIVLIIFSLKFSSDDLRTNP
jgi:hypothetical protein